ncbi:MAG: zinc-ribbon domain-containing protein [Gemmataceae bacterium]|nr:zinc-ribbon domain-containing protein [Gemmataceae bacterium]
MANLLVCPHCKKELRTSAAASAGLRVKCPACQTLFEAAPFAAETDSPGAAKASPAGGRRRVGVLVAGAVAIAGATLFLGYVWPGFLRSGNRAQAAANQAQARNLLAFLPANSSAVAGIHVGQVRKQPELRHAWKTLQRQLAQFNQIPPEARDLIDDADMVLLAGGTGPQSVPVVVLSTDHPFDPDEIRTVVRAGPAREHQGMSIWPSTAHLAGKTGCLALPTDRIAVFGFMESAELAAEVAAATQPRLHADLKAQIDQVSGSVIWAAVQFDESTKQRLRELGNMAPVIALGIPEITTIAPIALRGKGGVITVDLADGQKVKLSIGFTCHDADDAAKLRSTVLDLWLNRGEFLMDMVGAQGGPKLTKLLAEVSATFDLEQRDNSVLLSVQVNQATLDELLTALPLFK